MLLASLIGSSIPQFCENHQPDLAYDRDTRPATVKARQGVFGKARHLHGLPLTLRQQTHHQPKL
jgi:hypothetical protein